jgi:nicotinamide mononucleotide (NMN) deamidase PncC
MKRLEQQAAQIALDAVRGIIGADGDERQTNIGDYWVWLRVERRRWRAVSVERWE